MAQGKIVATMDGHIGRIVFDNPAKMNAVSKAMWDELADAMEAFGPRRNLVSTAAAAAAEQ